MIDKHLRLIGRITIDDLVDVMSEEYEEDMAIFAGTGAEEVFGLFDLQNRTRSPALVVTGHARWCGLLLLS